jgi:hypothetical protein
MRLLALHPQDSPPAHDQPCLAFAVERLGSPTLRQLMHIIEHTARNTNDEHIQVARRLMLHAAPRQVSWLRLGPALWRHSQSVRGGAPLAVTPVWLTSRLQYGKPSVRGTGRAADVRAARPTVAVLVRSVGRGGPREATWKACSQLRVCSKITSGFAGGFLAGWRGATREHTRSSL